MKINIDEALRYLKMSNVPDEMRERVEQVATELEQKITPKFVFRVFTLLKKNDTVILEESGTVLSGKTAAKMLSDCEKAAVLLCTLGFEAESYLRTLQARDMSAAVIADACASAYVEYGCDLAENEIKNLFPDMYLTDRFSPGYGDLSLEIQPEILRELNGEKRLGVYLTDALLFNPSKTVSAIVGISERQQAARVRGCSFCTLKDKCEFRKEGGSCDK